ncbi:MAG: hypothetical protein AAF747_04120 [Planctomycetota bacterium]
MTVFMLATGALLRNCSAQIEPLWLDLQRQPALLTPSYLICLQQARMPLENTSDCISMTVGGMYFPSPTGRRHRSVRVVLLNVSMFERCRHIAKPGSRSVYVGFLLKCSLNSARLQAQRAAPDTRPEQHTFEARARPVAHICRAASSTRNSRGAHRAHRLPQDSVANKVRAHTRNAPSIATDYDSPPPHRTHLSDAVRKIGAHAQPRPTESGASVV